MKGNRFQVSSHFGRFSFFDISMLIRAQYANESLFSFNLCISLPFFQSSFYPYLPYFILSLLVHDVLMLLFLSSSSSLSFPFTFAYYSFRHRFSISLSYNLSPSQYSLRHMNAIVVSWFSTFSYLPYNFITDGIC